MPVIVKIFSREEPSHRETVKEIVAANATPVSCFFSRADPFVFPGGRGSDRECDGRELREK